MSGIFLEIIWPNNFLIWFVNGCLTLNEAVTYIYLNEGEILKSLLRPLLFNSAFCRLVFPLLTLPLQDSDFRGSYPKERKTENSQTGVYWPLPPFWVLKWANYKWRPLVVRVNRRYYTVLYGSAQVVVGLPGTLPTILAQIVLTGAMLTGCD